LAVVAVTALSAAMLSALAPGPASAATVGQVLFAHSFARDSFSSDYVPGVHSAIGVAEFPTVPSGSNVVCLTVPGGAGTPASCSNASDTELNGVLQLTPSSGDQEGALFSNLGFPTSNGLDMTFDSYQWPSSGADGLSFIVTAVNPSSPTGPTEVGQPGGSLGYAPNGTLPGVSDGYLGVGLDVYGDYSTSGVDGAECYDPAYISTNSTGVPGQVVVRGPGDSIYGYCALASTATSTTSSPLLLTSGTRAGAMVPVEVVINPQASSVQTNSGYTVLADSWEVIVTLVLGSVKILSGTLPSAAAYDPSSWLGNGGIPKDIAFGWVGSTGSITNNHDISDAVVETLITLPILDVSSNEYGSTSQGSPVTYVDTPTIDSFGTTESQPVTVNDTLPTGVTPTSGGGPGWSCSVPSGQTISCATTTSEPWSAGATLPSVYINGVVTSASETQSELSGTTTTSSNYVVTSSSDGEPAGTYSTQQSVPSAPTVSSISPTSGPLGGGALTVTGTNLSMATQVEIGTAAQIAAGSGFLLPLCPTSTAVAGCFVVPGGQVSISSMPVEPAGTDEVSVTTEGESVDAGNYIYDAAPTVTSISPSAGELTGGDTVTINGTGLASVSSVYFGANRATVNTISDTSLTVFSPPGSLGTVYIAVYNESGMNSPGTADQFSYDTTPAVTSISPLGGKPAGGDTVTITGTGLAGTTGVTTGTPKVAGTYTVTLSATDSSGSNGTAGFAWTITRAAGLFVATVSLAPGQARTAYSQTLAASGGAAPNSWSVTTGSLPTGLSLKAGSGTISGRLAVGAKTTTFGVTVTDSSGQTAARSYTVTVIATSVRTAMMAALPDGKGYWLVSTDGAVRSFGAAVLYGSMSDRGLADPIVGIIPTPDGGGYWLVASDGGVFNFGDAHFYGSTGRDHLTSLIVGMVPTPDAKGYWLVSSGGRVFTFGDAHSYAAKAGMRSPQPIVGMVATPDAKGYWLVARGGAVFSFGEAHFYGSAGNSALARPIVGMVATASAKGYWLVANDGGIFTYGDARFYGCGA
jgi:hypothetical protein